MKRQHFVLLMLLGMLSQGFAEEYYGWQKSCEACHTCRNPSAQDPCLLECPREHMATVFEEVKEGPPVVLLDHLSDQYVPVIFAHQLHAQMTQMGGGCTACHHHNPPGMILACRDCHGGPDNPQDLRRPGLKGAYHRQCLSCHREWSHETKCSVCHVRKTADLPAITMPDPTDIMGILHPNVEEPDTVVFTTGYEDGALVTFHHQEHVGVFDFKCVTCHRKENCSHCHDPVIAAESLKTLQEHHQPCYDCHREEDGCEMCHTSRVQDPFDHLTTGWPLSRHHQSAKCRQCHHGELRFESLDPDCLSCHEDWQSGSFDHARTGLQLNEMHVDFDCVDCHLESRFDQPPSCADCHEEDIAYPGKLPGTRMESGDSEQ